MADDGSAAASNGDESSTYPTGLKLGYTVLFVLAVIANITINAYIGYKFNRKCKHRSYLMYFNFTIMGLMLLIFDRMGDIWSLWGYNYWFWWCYIFGQNLLVAGELIRAVRLVLIMYPERVKIEAKKLTTRAMILALAVVESPVVLLYVLLAATENETYDYLCVAYYCLELVLLIFSTALLWRKRKVLRQHMLSETRILAAFSTILALLIVWDNVRYYGFQEDAYGESATTWAYVDLATLIVVSILLYWIWISHIIIMWVQDFRSVSSAFGSSEVIEDFNNKKYPPTPIEGGTSICDESG